MTPFYELEERYRNDPAFKQVVDMMVHHAQGLQMSPGELRMAAVFAEWHVQLMRPPKPMFMTATEARDRGIMITDTPEEE